VGAASALGLIVATRIAQAAISSGILPAAQAYMADITAPEQRAGGMGVLSAAIGLGAIVGAALAWQIAGHNPSLAFALVAVFAAVAFAIVFLFAHEPVKRTDNDSSLARLHFETIWPFLAITVVLISAYSILQQVTALRLQDARGFTIEDSISWAGAALMATALAMIIVQACAVRLFLWTPERLLGVGALLVVLSMLLCSFPAQPVCHHVTITLCKLVLDALKW